MVNEVINIGIGSAGTNILDSIYSQLALEHQIDNQGNITNLNENSRVNTCFQEVKGQYTGRCLFAANDSNSINNILTEPRSRLYNKNCVIQNKESCASNYIRGRYTIGRELSEDLNNRMRIEAEKCDCIDAFHIHGSVVGGSAGLMTLFSQRLSVDFGKKSKLVFTEWPSPNQSNIVVDSYNAVLGIPD